MVQQNYFQILYLAKFLNTLVNFCVQSFSSYLLHSSLLYAKQLYARFLTRQIITIEMSFLTEYNDKED